MSTCSGWAAASKKTLVPKEQDPVKRAAYQEEVAKVPVEKLVFLDESGFKLDLHKRYGWTIGGGRCQEVVPVNAGMNHSVLGAYSLPAPGQPSQWDRENTGSHVHNGVWALWQKPGGWTKSLFLGFLIDELLPLLPAESVLVLDNASIHKGKEIEEAVERANCKLLYLPPYSPDFNPIEKVWSWMKNTVRKIMPQDADERKKALYRTAQAVPAHAAPGWFSSCGLS